MQKYNILELNEKLLPELQSIAEELGIKKVSSLKKEELVYRILDEQAISYAGIQAEKMKEKEAKKPAEGRKRGRPAKSPKVAKAETAETAESTQQAPEKLVTAPADKKEQKEQPERKKRVRIEKKEKVAGAIAPSEDNKEVVVSKEPQTISTVTEISAVETPAVAESPVEKPLLPPVVAELETEEEAVSLRLFMGEPSSTKGRRQRQSDEAGNRNGDRNRDSKLLIEHTGGAAHKGCRNEHTGQDQNRRDNRAGDFRHSQNGCIDRIHGFFGHIAFDVFHHHDGIVHHQTNRQHQTKQRQQVDREPKRQHSHESTSQSDHNGRARNCCGFKALQEDVDHADNKKHCFKQRLNYFIDRNSNKLCRVDSDLVI